MAPGAEKRSPKHQEESSGVDISFIKTKCTCLKRLDLPTRSIAILGHDKMLK